MSINGKLFYFCYGSNLWSKRIQINVKSAVKYGNGLLNDWKLTFSGDSKVWSGSSADIVSQNHSTVWGTVWTISESDLHRLDKQEVGYNRIEVDVVINGDEEVVHCITYVQKEEYKNVKSDSNPDHIPSLLYKTVIINGAVEQQLPEEYIEFIKSFKDNGILNTGPSDLKL